LIDVNNLRHTEDHLNVGKVYQNVSISKYMAKTKWTLVH